MRVDAPLWASQHARGRRAITDIGFGQNSWFLALPRNLFGSCRHIGLGLFPLWRLFLVLINRSDVPVGTRHVADKSIYGSANTGVFCWIRNTHRLFCPAHPVWLGHFVWGFNYGRLSRPRFPLLPLRSRELQPLLKYPPNFGHNGSDLALGNVCGCPSQNYLLRINRRIMP